MDERLKVSYETMGSSSYMTVTCPEDMELIHYQLEMMISNDIKKLLPVSRQVIDGETVIYYNITSRLPLEQVLEKRKLTRKELLRLIEGAILAIRDGADFRLPSDGIMMEAGKIYVNPASCDPAFMFLPVQGAGGYGIKEMITDLIMNDKIEMSDDNLIQVLLKELNNQPFSIDQLEKSLKPYRNITPGTQGQKMAQSQQINSQPVDPRPVNLQPVNPQVSIPQVPVMPSFSQESSSRPAVHRPESIQPEGQISKGPKLSEEKDDKKKKKNRQKKEKTDAEETFDSEKAKKKFMIPQAFLMVAVAAGISFGLFTDENGGIAVNTILACVIGIVVAEIILYREIYINSRNSKADKKSSGKKEKRTVKVKNESSKARPIPPRPSQPPLPQQVLHPQSSPLQQDPYPQNSGIQQMTSAQASISQPSFAAQPVQMQQPLPMPPQVPFMNFTASETEDTCLGDETELWGETGQGGMSAYLEYYENGKLSRIPIDSLNGIVIGRLKEQVDFAVKSPRVGKVHARFFTENGQYFVVDINSKNGTYINGSRTRIESNTPCILHDKDRIMLADSEFTIRCTEG